MKKLSLAIAMLAASFVSGSALAAPQSQNAQDCIDHIEAHFIWIKIGGHDGGKVRELNLASCNLRDRNIADVVSFLDKHLETYYVDLSNNNMGPAGATLLAKTRAPIKGLYLSNNNLNDEGAIEIANVSSNDLGTIILEHNHIGDRGASALAHLNVRLMELSNNDISDVGAAALATNTAIEDLRLGYNDIGDEGAAALARTTSLNALVISYNHIGHVGLNALRANTYLQSLMTEGNNG
jgi:Ran GTPase-activating protein (RanGAP) involved in mRNA processing and transport